MIVFHSPNAPPPIGYPIVNMSDAVDKLIYVEKQCPGSRLIVGSVSPHDYRPRRGAYGKGADWLGEFVALYERETGRDFAHALGVVLSENNHADEYPIRDQLADYMVIKERHNVDIVVTFFNLKHGSYSEWLDSLSLVWPVVDGLFIYAPQSSPSHPPCYRSLICNGELTIAGQAVVDFMDNK